jgi:uncharacterized protein YjbJ (UPF0337 family)
MKLKSVVKKLGQILCVSIAALTLFSGIVFGWGSSAVAGENVANAVQNRAEQGLNRVAGAGTANQIEGRAKEDIGRVQRQVDKATSQVGGTTKQATGRAQRDIGRTQGAVEDAANEAQDSAEGFVDSVKDFFGQ